MMPKLRIHASRRESPRYHTRRWQLLPANKRALMLQTSVTASHVTCG